MRSVVLAFLFGILTCQQYAQLPNINYAWLLILLLPLAFFAPSWLRLAAAFGCGLLYALLRASLILEQNLPLELERQDVMVEGSIVSLPEPQFKGLRFEFAVSRLSAQGRDFPSPGRIRLSWTEALPTSGLEPHQSWRLTARLKRAHGLRNGSGFDYEAWLFQHRLRATGTVRHKKPYQLLSTPNGWEINTLRYRLLQKIQSVTEYIPHQGLIIALALGAQHLVQPEEWEVLRRTGTSHLMAISGLHLSFVALLGMFLGKNIWRFSGLLLLLPIPYFAAACGIITALLYALLAGFSIPTQRAFLMVTIVFASLFWNRSNPAFYGIFLALLGVLLWDPFAVLAAGFWLSFGAVAIIGYGLQGRLREPLQWVRLHFVVIIGLVPLLLSWFGQLPLLSPVSNFIAVPMVTFIIMPIILIGTFLLAFWQEGGELLLTSSGFLLKWLWIFLEYLAYLPGTVWHQPRPPFWTLLAAGGGVLILLLPRGFPGRFIGFIWLLPALFYMPPQPKSGELWFSLLDVGQGMAAVLRTQNHVLLYDSGPNFFGNPDTDAGETTVVPFLHSQGIQRLDALLISHGDSDHSGGALSILKTMPVERMIANDANFPYPAIPCRAGLHWNWEGVDFTVLHPTLQYAHFKDNNQACVLKVSSGKTAILLTGDIESSAERHLVLEQQIDLQADILIAPHHGSRTSSSPLFINAVQPRFALFSVGYQNHFGHPKLDIVERYRQHGAIPLTTAEEGAIHFVLNPQGIQKFTTARRQFRRYWQRD